MSFPKYFLPVVCLCALLVSPSALAGKLSGPTIHKDTVRGNTTDRYVDAYEGGVNTTITVRGDGSSDIDCKIYDSNGNLIDSDTRPQDACVLSFTPKWTGKFELKIINLGNNDNEYTLTTN